MYIRYLDFVEREDLSVLVSERERVCVCQTSRLLAKNHKYQKIEAKQKRKAKRISRTFANVRVRLVNWTYANIRNYD